MKPITTLFASAVILLSSCTMTKRYHNRGFQVNFNWGKEKGETETSKIAKKDLKAQSVSTNKKAYAKFSGKPFDFTHETTSSFIENQTFTFFKHKEIHIKKVKRISKHKLATAYKLVNTEKSTLLDIPSNSVIKEKDSSLEADGTVEMILIFICCLIIPPLGYYLKKRVTDTWFWVCLLCALLSFSFFFGVGYGILGFVSVVIALLAFFEVL